MSDVGRSARRRSLYVFGGFAAVVAVVAAALHSTTDSKANRSRAQLVLPAGIGPLRTERLRDLDGRFDAVHRSRGLAGMREQIVADLRAFAGNESRQELIVEWIALAAWDDAADLLIDAAECGGTDLRRNCAVLLSTRRSSLLSEQTHGPRITRLLQSESDGHAKGLWGEVRERLRA